MKDKSSKNNKLSILKNNFTHLISFTRYQRHIIEIERKVRRFVFLKRYTGFFTKIKHRLESKQIKTATTNKTALRFHFLM